MAGEGEGSALMSLLQYAAEDSQSQIVPASLEVVRSPRRPSASNLASSNGNGVSSVAWSARGIVLCEWCGCDSADADTVTGLPA